MCLFPTLIKNKKYSPTKKNGGVVPLMKDPRVGVVPIGCKNCMECFKEKANGWRTRLHIEYKGDNRAKFVTLTFSTKSLKELSTRTNKKGYERDNDIAHKAVELFTNRWKKKYGKRPKHWLITELGNGRWEHVHLHGIIWLEEGQTIHDVWQYGRVDVGRYTNAKTINYITKYVTKRDENHKEYKPKIMATKGMGAKYVNTIDGKSNKYNKTGTKEYYRTESGIKSSLPIYLRNKIYTDEEREKLWLEKLDKGVRYVNGIKVKENDKETYYKLLNEARRINRELGYGDKQTNWEQKEYENQRRDMLMNERLS